MAAGAGAPWDRVAGDVGAREYLTEGGEESIGVVCAEGYAESCAAAFRTGPPRVRDIFDVGESGVSASLSTFLFFGLVILKTRKRRSPQKQEKLQR